VQQVPLAQISEPTHLLRQAPHWHQAAQVISVQELPLQSSLSPGLQAPPPWQAPQVQVAESQVWWPWLHNPQPFLVAPGAHSSPLQAPQLQLLSQVCDPAMQAPHARVAGGVG
jgi:hypothetical protein